MDFQKTEKCIFVLGMHRSGTSLLTSILNSLGAGIGSDLIVADSNNPEGYFENLKINQLNEEILATVGSSWDNISAHLLSKAMINAYFDRIKKIFNEEFKSCNVIALKDPRLCFLFPIYEQVFKQLDIGIEVVIPIRNPLEVAESLKTRDRFSFEKSMLLWASHFLWAEYYSRLYKRLFIRYDKLVNEKKKIIKHIAEFFQFDSSEIVFERSERLIIEDLKHYNNSFGTLSGDVPLFISQTIELILSSQFENAKDFDQIRREFLITAKFFFDEDILKTSSPAKEYIKLNEISDHLIENLQQSQNRISQLEEENKKAQNLFATTEKSYREKVLRLEEENVLAQQSQRDAQALLEKTEQKFKEIITQLEEENKKAQNLFATTEKSYREKVLRLEEENVLAQQSQRDAQALLEKTEQKFKEIITQLEEENNKAQSLLTMTEKSYKEKLLRLEEENAQASDLLTEHGKRYNLFLLRGESKRKQIEVALALKDSLVEVFRRAILRKDIVVNNILNLISNIEKFHCLINFYISQQISIQQSPFLSLLHFRRSKHLNRKIRKMLDNVSFPLLQYFSEEDYLVAHEDVRLSVENKEFKSGLEHFILFGVDEARKNQRIINISITADIHEISVNYVRGIHACDSFDETYYLDNYPDIKEAAVDPYDHYYSHGWKEGRKPNCWFDPSFYLQQYRDVRLSNEEPLAHYLEKGWHDGKMPCDIPENYIRNKPFFESLHEQNISNLYQRNFVTFENHESFFTQLKLIAFYLPQFHPIPENDKAWGAGFTEWTNVSKALPQFEGHYQPRLPGELGYYDLRLIETQKRQIDLARNYGLYGFCYHYYWFDGKRVLDRPLQQVLDNSDLDFPFCINWANENWTKRWDGLDQEIILQQNHSVEDDLAFFRSIQPILLDRRYIRVDGKAVLMIYRPQLFPDIKATVARWRGFAREVGVGELFLILSHSFEHQDPREIGFDAATEFAPNTFHVSDITTDVNLYNGGFSGKVYDYSSAINYSIKCKKPDYLKFRSICPGWDNEARKPGKGTIFGNSSPESYEKWLEYLLYYTNENFETESKIIFINAWNEWAEGAYLEPDRKYGYAYLEATYRALKTFSINHYQLLQSSHRILKKSDTAVILHLFYPDLWEEIHNQLRNFKQPFDLYVTLISKADMTIIFEIQSSFPNVQIFIYENRGRDILPFIKVMKNILPLGYRYICKIHSKKSLHRIDGDKWRNHLIASLIGSDDRICRSKNLIDQGAGIVVGKGNIYRYDDWVGSNSLAVKQIAQKLGITFTANFSFPAGSMFWFNPVIFHSAFDLISENDFVFEEGQIDGTYAHAFERIFGVLCDFSDKLLVEI